MRKPKTYSRRHAFTLADVVITVHPGITAMLAALRPRFGYRRLCDLLRREGHPVNHKRIHRLYRLAGLQVRRRRRGQVAATMRRQVTPATTPNEEWSMDLMMDTLANGRVFPTHDAGGVTAHVQGTAREAHV